MSAMASPVAVMLRSRLPMVAEDAPTSWVEVAWEGEWRGHPSGPFQLTREKFAEIIANFERQANPIPVDFHHDTERQSPGEVAPARGWVHDFELRDGANGKHLWSLVEFGPEAVRFNRSGGFRYCSMAVTFDAKDRVTGEPVGAVMTSLALDDQPFIDGQTPILLSARRYSMDKDEEKREMADAEEEKVEMAENEDEDEEKKELMADEYAPSPADQLLADLAARLDMDMDGLLGAMVERIDAIADMLRSEPDVEEVALSTRLAATTATLAAKDATIKTLSTRVEKLEAVERRARESEADRAADQLVASGRISPAGRAFARKVALSGRAEFSAYVASLPTGVPTNRGAGTVTPPPDETSATIPEDNETVKAIRVSLSNAKIPKAKQDEHIRRYLSARPAV